MTAKSDKSKGAKASNAKTQVIGMRSFTGKDGKLWTKFILSDGSTLLESGTYQVGKMVIAEEVNKADGKRYTHVYQAL